MSKNNQIEPMIYSVYAYVSDMFLEQFAYSALNKMRSKPSMYNFNRFASLPGPSNSDPSLHPCDY